MRVNALSENSAESDTTKAPSRLLPALALLLHFQKLTKCSEQGRLLHEDSKFDLIYTCLEVTDLGATGSR